MAAGIPDLKAGQRYEAVCLVVPDRVAAPGMEAHARGAARQQLNLIVGDHLIGSIWVTTDYAASARRRYIEICRMLDIPARAEVLGHLSNIRSLLITAWCIRSGGSR